MSLEALLSILGPGLTTAGATLLAYDVFRVPARLERLRQRTERLDAAEQRHDEKERSLKETKSAVGTGAHDAKLAVIDATLATTVGRVHSAHTAAATRDGARTFRLAVGGLMLVILGGIAETIAAILAGARHGA
jgi:hypothetical protein